MLLYVYVVCQRDMPGIRSTVSNVLTGVNFMRFHLHFLMMMIWFKNFLVRLVVFLNFKHETYKRGMNVKIFCLKCGLSLKNKTNANVK